MGTLKNTKILIVDDDPGHLVSVKDHRKKLGLCG